MKKHKGIIDRTGSREVAFEKLYPNANARRAADEAIEAVWNDDTITLTQVCVVWLAAYEARQR